MNADDRALLAQINAEQFVNRENTRAALEAADVPRAAWGGFFKATSYGADPLLKIERSDYGKRWIAVVGKEEFVRLQHAYIVGPRGGCRKIY